MTNEEALDILESGDWFSTVDNNLPQSTTSKVAEAINTLARAIRAEQGPLIREKWKPCANCRYEDEEMSIYYPDNFDGGLGFRYGLARYCPKCGRPLTEQAWMETEKRMRE